MQLFVKVLQTLKPLTPEERAAKAVELKQKLAEARVKKEETERREQVPHSLHSLNFTFLLCILLAIDCDKEESFTCSPE